MVSVTHSVAAQGDFEHSLQSLLDGVPVADGERVRRAVEFARSSYAERQLGSGESVWGHALGMALIVAGLRLDADARLAALLFALPAQQEHGLALIEKEFGRSVAHLVDGISRLNRVRPITRGFVAHSSESDDKKPQEMKAQIEVLRKMLLAMVEDIRVVILKLAELAWRTLTLRSLRRASPSPLRAASRHGRCSTSTRRLANRLGVWQLKWELEDLSLPFRSHPETYKQIAQQLDRRSAGSTASSYIEDVIETPEARVRFEAGVGDADVYGRPKHIFSIWSKMRKQACRFHRDALRHPCGANPRRRCEGLLHGARHRASPVDAAAQQ
jgi:GTP pyrophosphokinase